MCVLGEDRIKMVTYDFRVKWRNQRNEVPCPFSKRVFMNSSTFTSKVSLICVLSQKENSPKKMFWLSKPILFSNVKAPPYVSHNNGVDSKIWRPTTLEFSDTSNRKSIHYFSTELGEFFRCELKRSHCCVCWFLLYGNIEQWIFDIGILLDVADWNLLRSWELGEAVAEEECRNVILLYRMDDHLLFYVKCFLTRKTLQVRLLVSLAPAKTTSISPVHARPKNP